MHTGIYERILVLLSAIAAKQSLPSVKMYGYTFLFFKENNIYDFFYSFPMCLLLKASKVEFAPEGTTSLNEVVSLGANSTLQGKAIGAKN